MVSKRELFFKHVAQTSESPSALEVDSARACFLYDKNGKDYIDMVSGVAVSNIGHGHPRVVEAVKKQADKFMHLMVYGEYVINPQVEYADLLCGILPDKLNSVFFVNSGSEAVDAAMKLVRRYTGKSEIAAFRNAYHGGTQGAASLMSDNSFTHAYRPLVPGVKFLSFNETESLNLITEKTAAVFYEYVQAEGGIIPAEKEFMKALEKRCRETGSLLVADEVQTGFGRTGKMFAFEHYGVVPDILILAKAMGGGMPIGALVSDKTITGAFTKKPPLGHITTFGGHPVSAAAAKANLEVILEENLAEQSAQKARYFYDVLEKHPKVKSMRGLGLFISVETESIKHAQKMISMGLEEGYVSDLFLFDSKRFRIAPPLNISEKEVKLTISRLEKALDSL